ncbi:MAG: hypothetical protein JSW44_01640 [Candidatus Bathyarchaeota archaeon]|nr:MAG: hypothetical protein JSW44_01640 [Candidatus Bathyarchaeota archaeon]
MPNSFAGNYDQTYSFQVQFGLLSQELYISVPPSLYDYYRAKTPRLADDSEYATLVTPDAFKSIAESIRNLTREKPRNDEEFANAVLMLVHQIPYAISDVKYPIETLVENSGKCDTLSLLAASIMKAGGLDVVLLYFKEVHHINVGVYLPYEPHGTWWWLPPTGYEFDGKKYWIAECTPAMEWKVGDVPPLLADGQPSIISLEKSEASSPSYVSSKLGSPLNSSSISIYLSSEPEDVSDQERTLTISGSILPGYPNESVVVYFSQDGISYEACRTETDYWGNYSFSWNLNSTGTYYIRTSWSGNSDWAGADSEILTVFLGFPQSLIQFEGPNYYYTYGRAYIAAHELRMRQGVEDFLDIQLSGTGVLLTGEFIILRSGQVITLPRIGEKAESTRKIVVPKGFQPLRLPDDIGKTTNNQFGFILRNSGGNNYSLNVRGMDGYEMAQINQLDGNRTAFMNASTNIKENIWYKVAARISEGEIIANLHDINGTLLESMIIAPDEIDSSQLVILIANNTERAVAFKNLKIETLNNLIQPAESDEKTANDSELLAPYVNLAILLVATFAAVVYLRKRRQVKGKNKKTCK